MDYADMMERDMQKVWAYADAAQKAAIIKHTEGKS